MPWPKAGFQRGEGDSHLAGAVDLQQATAEPTEDALKQAER